MPVRKNSWTWWNRRRWVSIVWWRDDDGRHRITWNAACQILKSRPSGRVAKIGEPSPKTCVAKIGERPVMQTPLELQFIAGFLGW